ncbi:MAG: AAA family ATPase [Clostridia bacterium]|nr:AAA family ATPase [Clostridia bacterium]
MNKIIAVTSGKGGTGKSTFSVGLALALKKAEKSVLMIDMDSGLRCLDLLLGVDEQVIFDISDALAGKPLDACVLHSPKYSGVDLIPAAINEFCPSAEDFGNFVEKVSRLYDVVIIDCPSGSDFTLYSMLPRATEFVCVCNPNPVSVRDTATVGSRLRAIGRNGRIIINKYDYYCIGNSVFKTLDDLIDISGLKLLGIIPLSLKLEIAFYGGYFPIKGKEFKAYKRIATRLMGESVPIPKLSKI